MSFKIKHDRDIINKKDCFIFTINDKVMGFSHADSFNVMNKEDLARLLENIINFAIDIALEDYQYKKIENSFKKYVLPESIYIVVDWKSENVIGAYLNEDEACSERDKFLKDDGNIWVVKRDLII